MWIGLVVALTMCAACTEPPPVALVIVQRSIDFHGGMEAYRNLDSLAWSKTTRLLAEDGSTESIQTQLQSFDRVNEPGMTLQWTVDSTDFLIGSGKELLEYRIGDMVLQDRELLEEGRAMASAAEYVFFQPFKLLDSGTTLEYGGQINLGDSLVVDVVKVSYEDDSEGSDRWKYYFTPEGRFVANSVQHKGRTSLIINTAQQLHRPSGLLLHRKRKSYFVDSLLNIRYLRADYLYELQ